MKKNWPMICLKWLGDAVADAGRPADKLLFDRAMDYMQNNVSELMAAWMGMHKLATTPMPFPYVQMLYFLLYFYMYTVGIPLAGSYGWVGVIVCCVLAFALFGINAIGQELEDPFGNDANDLPIEFFEGASN